MTPAFAEFQRRAEAAGCEGQWLTEAHWQVHGLRRVDVYPRGGTFYREAEKFYGSPWLAIVCRACNTKHVHYPNDSYRNRDPSRKPCAKCRQMLPIDRFHHDARQSTGFKANCKECCNARHRDWTSRNREHVNAKQRARRAVAC